MAHNEVTRRRLLGGGSAALAAGIAGCVGGLYGGSGGDNGSSDSGNESGDGGNRSGGGGAGRIKYWNIHNGDDFRQPINEIVSSFEKDSGATVKARYIDNDSISEQLSSAVASDTLPTVGLFGVQTIQRLGADGSLSAKRTAEVVENIGTDDFRKGPINFMSAGDSGYYGIPADAWVQGIWYRKSKFEEAGLDPPVTWDAIMTAAETFHNEANGQYGIGFGTKVTAYARQNFTQFARSNGARVLDADANVVFDSKEMIETLAYLKELGQYMPGAVSFDDTRNLYGNKQTHMFLYSSYLLPDLLSDKGPKMVKNTSLAPATEKTRRSTYGQVLGHCLFNQSDAKLQTGQNLVNHIMSDNQYVKWCHMQPGGTLPVLKSTVERKAYLNNKTLNKWSSTIDEISSALGNMERFDIVDGKLLPEFGQITSKSLVAEAVNRITIKNHEPKTVATEQAKKMRNALS